VPGDVLDAQRLGVLDQQAEHTAAVREGDPGECGALLLAQPGGDELLQVLTGLVEHAQGAVAGADQVHRGGDDPPQHGGQVQLAADREDGVEQPLQPVLGVGQGPQLGADPFQLAVEMEPEVGDPGWLGRLGRLRGGTGPLPLPFVPCVLLVQRVHLGATPSAAARRPRLLRPSSPPREGYTRPPDTPVIEQNHSMTRAKRAFLLLVGHRHAARAPPARSPTASSRSASRRPLRKPARYGARRSCRAPRRR
jgi:hypothetical protein